VAAQSFPRNRDGLNVRWKRALPVAVLAAGWCTGAYLLWQTDVPGNLDLSEVDPRRYFSPATLQRTRDYEALLRVLWIASIVAVIGVLWIYAQRGARFARESAAGRIGTGMLLGMLGLGFAWLVELPFGIVGLWWERRHHIAKQSYLDVIFGGWIGLASTFVSACLAILIAMALAGRFPRRWWIPAAPVFVALGFLGAFLQPYLMSSELHPLRRPAIERDARELERSEGVSGIPVKLQKVKKQTSEPNAQAIGIGPSRRVVLWDTLLDGRFSRRQIRVILAHELGHQKRQHILKGIGWYALFALPGAWLVAELTRRRRGGMQLPEAVPVALFAVILLQIATLPVGNLITRHIEAEADWVALEHARDPTAARDLFRNFAKTSLSQPRPPTWDYVLFENHPTIVQRIAMINAWETREVNRGR
jgi:STE24 endopeptidase